MQLCTLQDTPDISFLDEQPSQATEDTLDHASMTESQLYEAAGETQVPEGHPLADSSRPMQAILDGQLVDISNASIEIIGSSQLPSGQTELVVMEAGNDNNVGAKDCTLISIAKTAYSTARGAVKKLDLLEDTLNTMQSDVDELKSALAAQQASKAILDFDELMNHFPLKEKEDVETFFKDDELRTRLLAYALTVVRPSRTQSFIDLLDIIFAPYLTWRYLWPGKTTRAGKHKTEVPRCFVEWVELLVTETFAKVKGYNADHFWDNTVREAFKREVIYSFNRETGDYEKAVLAHQKSDEGCETVPKKRALREVYIDSKVVESFLPSSLQSSFTTFAVFLPRVFVMTHPNLVIWV